MMMEGGLEFRAGEEYDEEEDEEAEARRKRRLDDHFATLYAEFDDEKLGELEEEDLEGGADALKDYEFVLDQQIQDMATAKKVQKDMEVSTKTMLKSKIQETCEDLQDEEKEMKDVEEKIAAMSKKKEKEKWDCESILSTYSNVSNHPSLISEPRRNKVKQIKLTRSGIPLEGLPDRPEKDDEDDELETVGEDEIVNFGVRRNKVESKAEKKARKAAMKARRRETRQRKKGTRGLFKSEKKIVTRNTINNQIANPSGIKL